MQFKFLEPLWYMSQYTVIYKYGKRTRQLKFKKELRISPSRNNGENRFALELNEKDVQY